MIYELQRNFSSTDRGYKFIISLSNKISPEIRKLKFSRSESWARALSQKLACGAGSVDQRASGAFTYRPGERKVVKKSLFGLLMCAETIIESHFYYTQPRF
jgi:hypothetical protein